MLVKLNFISCETQFHRVSNSVSLGDETQFHTLHDFSPAHHAWEKNSKLRKLQLNSLLECFRITTITTTNISTYTTYTII